MSAPAPPDAMSTTPSQPNEAELVVIRRQVATSTAAASMDDDLGGFELQPLFPDITQKASAPDAVAEDDAVEDLSAYLGTTGPEDELESIAERLRERDDVEAAYVKPPAELATLATDELTDSLPAPGRPIPSFVSRQGYLGPAPVGIDAAAAWSMPGGKGAGIDVIDCEWGWQFTHGDLRQNNLGLVGGRNSTERPKLDHGTAVMGEIGGDHNSFGVHGIAPDARLGGSSVIDQGTAGAIAKAAHSLKAGDILLIEMHRRGPNGGGGGQQGYIAMEWWPDDLAAIRFATRKGVIVVEAAGNGWEDLDAAIYDKPGPGFPASWKNPFREGNPSSGAVVVGAGCPPSGTHGRTGNAWGPYVDRARCGFSNWGSRVDAQGWGFEVTSAGYGNLYDAGEDATYTDVFGGTSSASPIVVGALAATQGVLKQAGMPLLSPLRARQLLRATGSPQTSAADRPASQRIGNRPNLKQLVPAALRQWIRTTIDHTYAVSASKAAWAYVNGYGWRRIKADSPEGIASVLSLCVDAQVTRSDLRVEIDTNYLYTVWAS